jgi:hypothetical protein
MPSQDALARLNAGLARGMQNQRRVHYRPVPNKLKKKRCELCLFFRDATGDNGHCVIVSGPISRMGTCDKHEAL